MQGERAPEPLEATRKELRVQKQLCAKRFGEAKRAGEHTEALKEEMQRITQALEELDALGAQPKSVVASPRGESRRFPPRFDAQPPCIDDVAAEAAEIRLATVADHAAWDAFVDAHPAASLYHHSVWRDLIVKDMGHRDISLLALGSDGTVLGVLPLIEMRSWLFGNFAVSLPYFNYGGPLALHPRLEERLMRRAGDVAAEHQLKHAEIRETHPRPGWPVRDNKVLMIRPLPASDEAFEAELGSKLRAQVKRAERERPEVLIGGVELLDDFYAAFARNMRDLGTPVYGKGFFRAVLRAWPEHAHLVAVRLGGKPVGGAILLGYRDMLEIPWASTVRDVSVMGINMLMYRRILSFAISRGYGFFDFGRSTKDAGTYRFKRQWGASELPSYWHYWLAAGRTLPRLSPDNPKFQMLIATWQRLPVLLSRVIGARVVRSIP